MVGYLVAAAPRPGDETFRQAMRELGYVEGQNITIESRFARGNAERLREGAVALVRRNVDVIDPRSDSASRGERGDVSNPHRHGVRC